MRTSRRVEVSNEDRAELERLARSPTTGQRVVLRARIVLLSAEGVSTGAIVERLGRTTSTITRAPARLRGALHGVASSTCHSLGYGRWRAHLVAGCAAAVAGRTARLKSRLRFVGGACLPVSGRWRGRRCGLEVFFDAADGAWGDALGEVGERKEAALGDLGAFVGL